MKIKYALVSLLFIGLLSSCSKEEPLTPINSSIVSPSEYGGNNGEPTEPPPPPSHDDDEGNPFEIG